MLTDLLREPIERRIAEAKSCREWVRDVNEAYLNLERIRISAERIVGLKFACVFWRFRLLNRLIRVPPNWATTRRDDYFHVLLDLRTYIPTQLHFGLAKTLTDPTLFASLLARQGIRQSSDPHLLKEAGPDADLNIIANRNSRWPFSRWKERKEFSEYEFEGDGVHYRGVFFRPGDVLLCNVNLDGNGVYTSLSDPKNFSSHSAFLAILQDKGRRFPAAIETYEKGVRAVPLNVFLGPRFSAYTEVYRYKKIAAHHTDLINSLALKLLSTVKGYNFDSEDRDREYMSCTSVGRFLHQDAGLRPVRTKSEINAPMIVSNLKKVGYTFFNFFAPVDYLIDGQLQCVGWIDNNQFTKLLARELIDRQFRAQFASRELNPSKFPFMSRVNLWGIRHIRRRTLSGRLISAVEGFDHVNLPKGPDELIAVITLVESQLGKAIRMIHSFVEDEVRHHTYFDLEQFAKTEHVIARLETCLKLPWLNPGPATVDEGTAN